MTEDATVEGTPAGGRLEIGVLGPLTVTTASGPFVPRGRLRTLFAWLALVGPDGTSAERLAELVWSDDAPLHPLRQLQAQLHQLRRSVGADALTVSHSRVGLTPWTPDIDADRFTALLCGGPSGPRERALRVALALWRGRPYPELAEHTDAMGEIRRLKRLRLLAVAELALIRLRGPEPPCDVVADLYPALADDGDANTLAPVVAVGLARAARRVEALRSLHVLEPGDDDQRAWRAATEHAIRVDDAVALAHQLEELESRISAAWPPEPAPRPSRLDAAAPA